MREVNTLLISPALLRWEESPQRFWCVSLLLRWNGRRTLNMLAVTALPRICRIKISFNFQMPLTNQPMLEYDPKPRVPSSYQSAIRKYWDSFSVWIYTNQLHQNASEKKEWPTTANHKREVTFLNTSAHAKCRKRDHWLAHEIELNYSMPQSLQRPPTPSKSRDSRSQSNHRNPPSHISKPPSCKLAMDASRREAPNSSTRISSEWKLRNPNPQQEVEVRRGNG